MSRDKHSKIKTAGNVRQFQSRVNRSRGLRIEPLESRQLLAVDIIGATTTAVTAGNDGANAMALQSDGMLVVGGTSSSSPGVANDFALARYNVGGNLDLSFGDNGTTTIPLGAGDNRLNALTVLPDGKILAAGKAKQSGLNNDDFIVVRLLSNGSLDATFGDAGKLMIDLGTGDSVSSMVLQSDGKVLLAGHTNALGDYNFAIIRLNPDGSLDSSFDDDGTLIVSVGSGQGFASDLTLQADGKIVVAGHSRDGAETDLDFSVIRLNPDGSLDASFGSDGRVITPLGGGEDYVSAVATQADGRILLGGYGFNGDTDAVILTRYNGDGSLDTSFGAAGVSRLSTQGNTTYGSSLAIQYDGRIVVAGTSILGSESQFAVLRYLTDGSLDTTFGSGDGGTNYDFSPDTSHSSSGAKVLVQPDGKLLVAGTAETATKTNIALLRLLSDGTPDGLFANPIEDHIQPNSDQRQIWIHGSDEDDKVDIFQVGETLSVLGHLAGVPFSAQFQLAAIDRIFFDGRFGSDRIVNHSAVPLVANGGPGDDDLVGGFAADVLYGGLGDDFLVGRDRADFLDGEDGDDEIFAGFAANILPGDGTGDGVVDGADYTTWADNYLMPNRFGPTVGDFNSDGIVDAADYTIWADNFDGGGVRPSRDESGKVALGGEGDDLLLGSLGDDYLDGQAGNDTLFGGLGDDQLIGGLDDDQLDGQEGDDVLAAQTGEGESVNFNDAYLDLLGENTLLDFAPRNSAGPGYTPEPGISLTVFHEFVAFSFNFLGAGWTPELQAAADNAAAAWANSLLASYPGETITVDLRFADLGGRRQDGLITLARGGSDWVVIDNFSYPRPLANHLRGQDENGPQSDGRVTFNSNIAATNWAANIPEFTSTLTHELGHTLGFLTGGTRFTTMGPIGSVNIGSSVYRPSIFTSFVKNSVGVSLAELEFVNTQSTFGVGNDVGWYGTFGILGNDNAVPKIEATFPYDAGSDLSHLDELTFDLSIMSPIDDSGTRRTPSATELGILRDIGWDIRPAGLQLHSLGQALEIGSNSAKNNLWVIGTNPVGDGADHGVHRFDGSGWVNEGGGGVQIALAADGSPWLINSVNDIFHKVNGAWQQVIGKARDIGAGANGSIWAIGTDPVGTGGDYGVYSWNGSSWDNAGGGGVKIAVAENGTAYMVNSAHDIFKRVGNGWEQMIGKARDISVGAGNVPWVVGTDRVGDAEDYGIYYWNGSFWANAGGGGVALAIGNDGTPWLVNSAHDIYYREGGQWNLHKPVWV